MNKKFLRFLKGIYFSLLLCVFVGCNQFADETPPADVTAVDVTASSEQVSLSWQNPADSDFSNVEIYLSTARGYSPLVYTVEYGAASYTVDCLDNNCKYNIVLKTVDSNGNRSEGVSVSATPTDKDGPAEVRKFTVSYTEDSAVLSWLNPRDRKFAGVRITVSNNNTDVSSTESSNKVRVFITSSNSYTVTGLQSGVAYTFNVCSFDSNNVYSKGISTSQKMPTETPGLVFSLNSDGKSYSVTGFTGDDTVGATITPEQEAGKAANPISVVILSTYNGLPVTAIGAQAFQKCYNVVSVTLPQTITTIATNAFEGCCCLKGIALPSNLVSIADGAFWNCTNLKWMTIPKSVTSMGLGATLNDSSLSYVFYTGTKEEWKAFASTISNGNAPLTGTVLTFLNPSAEIRFGYDGISPIEFDAPQEVTGIITEPGDSHVKLSWTNPTDLDFAGTIISAKPADGSLAVKYTLNSTTTNSYLATNLENDTSYVFTICTFDKVGNKSAGVSSAKVVPSVSKKETDDGLLYYLSQNGISCVVTGTVSTNSLVIVPSQIESLPVTKLAPNAFAENTTCATLVLPKTITSLDSNALANCASLQDIYFGGDEADWIAMTGSDATVKHMHWNFTYETNDTTSPGDVVDLMAFKSNKKISIEFKMPADPDYYDSEIAVSPNEGTISQYTCGHYVVAGWTNGTRYVITVKSRDLYGNVSKGVSVSISPNEIISQGVTKEGLQYRVIDDASALSGINYEIYGVQNGEYKTSIDVPELIDDVPVVRIAKNAFLSCTKLQYLSLSKRICEIEPGALSVCDSLSNLTVDSDNMAYVLNADKTILYHKNLGSKEVAFVVHSLVGEIDFTGTKITAVGQCAMMNCKSVTSIVLPRDVKKIEASAFNNCSSLRKIVIPQSVQVIENNAFMGCSKLTSVCYTGSKDDWNSITIQNVGTIYLLQAQKSFDYGK